MTTRSNRWLIAASSLSMAANLFLLLWTMSADEIHYVSRDDLEAVMVRAPERFSGSAAWCGKLVDDDERVVFETASLVNFRGLFAKNVRRVHYVWKK